MIHSVIDNFNICDGKLIKMEIVGGRTWQRSSASVSELKHYIEKLKDHTIKMEELLSEVRQLPQEK